VVDVEVKNAMKESIQSCSKCGGKIKKEIASQEFEREGVKVELSGFKTWVCQNCGEIYFEPGGADRFAQAVNSLFALVFAERQHKGKLTAPLSSQ
jgi:YgiT-type zinc finger domain-containing protein